MYYIISSGKSCNGIIFENNSMTAMNDREMFVPDWKPQIIYLDFDGELTKYRNANLDLEIDGVQVEHSNLTPKRIEGIVASLNADFVAQNVLFVTERQTDTAYSTIFVGKTSEFDQYGKFAGLAETVDHGNQVKDDNAFVLLDAANSDSDIVSTIAHEAGHLLGTLDHGGEGLYLYAETYTVDAGEYFAVNDSAGVGCGVYYVLGTGEDRSIVPDVRSIIIMSGGSASLEWGASVSHITVKGGGRLGIEPWYNDLYCPNIVLYPGAIVGYKYTVDNPFTHLGDHSATLSLSGNFPYDLIARDVDFTGELTAATAYNTTVRSNGVLNLYGTATTLTVKSGGKVYYGSGGKLTGLMSFSSGAYVYSEGGILDFNISSLSPNAEPRVDNLSAVNGNPVYTLTVSNSQAQGVYTLAENALNFNKTISVVSSGGSSLGTLTVGQPTKIGDTNYTLNLEDGVLSVRIGDLDPVKIDYEFTDIGQTVYYDGQAPEGSELTGTLMMIPFTADITVTFDKSLSTGLYEFTTSVAEVPGAVNKCKIQIMEDFSDDDLWSVSYVSYNACHIGTKISETDSKVTYKFTNVDDYVLIDSIPEDTLEIGVAYGAADSDKLVLNSSNDDVIYYSGKFADSNKNITVRSIRGNAVLKNGDILDIIIEQDGRVDKKNNIYKYKYKYNSMLAWPLTTEKNGRFITFSIKTDSNLNADISLVVDCDTMTISDIERGEGILDLQGIKVGDKFCDWDRYPREQSSLYFIPAPWDWGHCWVAAASNMLAAAGYLSVSAKECYDILNKRYYIHDGNKSIGSNVQRVFKDVLIGVGLDLSKSNRLGNPSRVFSGRYIELGLRHIYSGHGNISGAISFNSINPQTSMSHVITVYDVIFDGSNQVTVVYADSDDGSDNIHNESPKKVKLTKVNDNWYINIYGQICIINAVFALVANNSETKLSASDLQKYDLIAGAKEVYSIVFEGISVLEDGKVIVSESIHEAVVQDEGNLTIASGAEAEEMIVHDGGTVKFNSGAIAKGTIRTAGGTLTVESGVDVSEAEFDFAVSYMDGGNSTRLLNDLHNVVGSALTITVVNGQSEGRYVLAGGASDFSGTLSVVGELDDLRPIREGFDNGLIGELGLDNTLNIERKIYSLSVEDGNLTLDISVDETIFNAPENPVGTADGVAWAATGAEQYVVEYSTDNFEHVIQVVTSEVSVDAFELPAGTYQWRVKPEGGEEWAVGESIAVSDAEVSPAPKVVQSNEDGNDDLFFATANGTWESIYYARHLGSVNDWAGTDEMVSASGKGRIQNLFFGSFDPNVLCLTDGENGDAIFVDDIFTDFPDEVETQTARLYRIREIRAGAGDDIVDMTSQRFEYVGEGLRIHGGEDNDTIWANKGDNFLFGDAGNDRIVGASGNDVIAGGIGNDLMHGGGGNDVFTFGENWGVDTVEQLVGGFVTLWFASEQKGVWDESTLTYTDGENSVTVSGVAAGQIELKFGDDGSEQFVALAGIGAFDAFTSRKVFEESGAGFLASM